MFRAPVLGFGLDLDLDQEKTSLATCACLFVSIERSGSGVELRTFDYENPGSNPDCGVKTVGKFFHSTLLQFFQLNK